MRYLIAAFVGLVGYMAMSRVLASRRNERRLKETALRADTKHQSEYY